MARFLRASTSATVRMGPFVSPSDGVTPYTSTPGTVYLSKAGGAFAARNDATSITHDRDGYHVVTLNATDTGTVGRLRAEVAGSSSNYLPVWEDFVVLDTSVYDVLFGTAPILTTTTDLSGVQVPSSAGAALKAAYSNLDATISSRSTYAGGAVASVTAAVTVGTNNDKTGYKLASDGLDSITVETGVNARQALSPILAASAGVISGASNSSSMSIIVKAANNSTTTRIAATADRYGNRSYVTLTLPA